MPRMTPEERKAIFAEVQNRSRKDRNKRAETYKGMAKDYSAPEEPVINKPIMKKKQMQSMPFGSEAIGGIKKRNKILASIK